MGLKVMDAVFGGVAAMDIQRNKLESGTPVLCDDAEVFLAGLVVMELVINGVIALLDFFHGAVVRHNAVAVMAGLERLDK